jgi:hypothetical protein
MASEARKLQALRIVCHWGHSECFPDLKVGVTVSQMPFGEAVRQLQKLNRSGLRALAECHKQLGLAAAPLTRSYQMLRVQLFTTYPTVVSLLGGPPILRPDILAHAVERLKRIEGKNELNDTRLMQAARQGSLKDVQRLLRASADVNATNAIQGTALTAAAFYGKGLVVDLLVKAKADVHVKTMNGKTAADFARDRGYKELAQRLDQAMLAGKSPTKDTFGS